MTMGYSTVVDGEGQPGDPEFVVDISDLRDVFLSMNTIVTLLVDMKEEREHAHARYEGFWIQE